MSVLGYRFLLISRVGPLSLHREWLSPGEGRGFDVLLSSYDPHLVDPALPDVTFEFRPGRKVSGYAEILHVHAELIARYDYVALFDDDLIIDAIELTRLFRIAAAYNVKIAQPALTHNSHFTYAALLHDAAFDLRYVNYIEMMCPVFRRDVLQAVSPLFGLGYESGIDLIWCNLTATSPADFAVIDAVTVRHARPVGAMKSANGFTGSRRYEDDIHAILTEFNIPWLSCVPYSGIRTSGARSFHRWTFIISSFKLIGAVFLGPGPRGRGRKIAVYWKHLVTRRPINLSAKLSQTAEIGQ